MMETNELKIRANGAYAYRKLDGKHEFDWPGIGKLVGDPDKWSMEARHFFLDYGARQWFMDGAAKSAGPDGKVDPLAKFMGMQGRIELANSGATDLRRPRESGGGGVVSWVTRALVALGTYQGNDVSSADRANAFVKKLADRPDLKLGGQVGKARTWLEKNSKIIGGKIDELKAADVPTDIDADAILAGLAE